jgi:AAA+ ATPase superfamily predicted ATPase
MGKRLKNPFPVNGYLAPEWFCNRKSETRTLQDALTNGRNITLHSFRRMGKTDLIHHVFHYLKKKGYITIYVDVFATENLKHFTETFATAIARACPEGNAIGKTIWSFIKSLRPVISYDDLSQKPEITFAITQEENKNQTIQQLLSVLEKLPRPVIIAFDEFQQITQYPEKRLEAWLRSSIQSLKNINFIFSGGQQHLLGQMFTETSRPFFGSTQIHSLTKIREEEYALFIHEKFADAKMKIQDSEIQLILRWTRAHTFYVQMVCNRLFAMQQKMISEEDVKNVFADILQENEAAYFNYKNILPENQWRMLSAIAKEGTVSSPTSNAFIHRYRLGSSSAVLKSVKALLDKEFVYQQPIDDKKALVVYDVFFSRWLEKLKMS